MVTIINAVRVHQIVLFFIVCVALGVVSAPIPVTPRGQTGSSSGLASCGGAADRSGACKLERRFIPLPPSIKALVEKHLEGEKLPANLPAIITGKDKAGQESLKLAPRDVAQAPLALGSTSSPTTKPKDATKSEHSTSPSESSTAPKASPSAEVKKPDSKKPKTGKSPATSSSKGKAAIAPAPAAQKPLVPPELQAPKPDPIIHPLHNHHVRLRPRGMVPDDDTRLVKRYYPLTHRIEHLEEIGYIPRPGQQKPLSSPSDH